MRVLNKIIIVAVFACVSFVLPAKPAQHGNHYKAKLAIIIDDIGNTRADAQAFYLPKKVTFSILPHTAFSAKYSDWSYQQGREVMLHMPMESLHGEALGEGALLANMYPNEVEDTLLLALESVPHAIGVNNHMGSKLTQITLQMNAVMDVLKQQDMLFVDSKTTRFSKAYQLAKAHGVTSASRHVFLDHEPNEAFLNQQFDALVDLARKRGSAIGIAHPYPVSMAFLQRKLAHLPDDVELINMSEYFGKAPTWSHQAPRLAQQEQTSTLVAPQ